MKGLPHFKTYGNYSSDNYGAHALKFSIGSMELYFSYQTPIAFCSPSTGLVVRVNDWSVTTGRHLNAIDGGNKKSRVSGERFEQMLLDAVAENEARRSA
jgi:hypothetical protein